MKSVNAEVNQLVEKKMVKNDPSDDKLSLFRQQVILESFVYGIYGIQNLDKNLILYNLRNFNIWCRLGLRI